MMLYRIIFYLIFLSFTFILVSCCAEDSLSNSEENKFFLPKLPREVQFCGKKILLDNFDLRERLDRELIVNTFYHSSTIQFLKRANRYFPEIQRVLAQEDLPEDFKYLCLIESGLTQAVSPSGAKGFWQFMPLTAKEFGLVINQEIDERLNIYKSTVAACEYLKEANLRLDDWILAAASYNRGISGISTDLKTQEVSSYFDLYLNNETSRYIFRILALKLIFENPKRYGFNIVDMELYEPIKIRELVIEESIMNLKHWAKENNSNYRMLRILNPWIRGNKLTVKFKPYIIQLPA